MSYYDTSTSFGRYLAGGSSNRDAWAEIESYLSDAGLSGLTNWAQDLLVEYGNELTDDQFKLRIEQTNEYKTRFQAIEIAKKNNQAPPTPAEIIATEKAYKQIFQQAGLPQSFYDTPEELAGLIGNGVSPQEMQSRVLDGYTAVRNDPTVQAQLGTLYGMGMDEGDLVAFFLDDEKGMAAIQRKQTAAALAAKSLNTGFGQLNQNQAESLAGQGITAAQAQQGFAELAQQRSLLNPLVSEQGSISSDTAIAAKFGNNADADEQLKRRRQERYAKFTGGGGYSTSNTGKTGIGTAS